VVRRLYLGLVEIAVVVAVIGSFFAFANQAPPAAVHSSTSGVTVAMPSGAGVPPANWGPSVGYVFADTSYFPDTVVVVMGVNNTVTWVNQDTAPHTVTFTVVPSGVTTKIDSGNVPQGGTFTYTFTVAGNYTYYCTYHPWMGGKMVVKGA
jgi:plastocyanin